MTSPPDTNAPGSQALSPKDADASVSSGTGGVGDRPRLSTHGWQDTGDVLYVDVGDAQMSLPIGELEWKLRYGNPETVRFSAASVIESYEYLIHHCTLKEATRRIMLMRDAYKKAWEHRERNPNGAATKTAYTPSVTQSNESTEEKGRTL